LARVSRCPAASSSYRPEGCAAPRATGGWPASCCRGGAVPVPAPAPLLAECPGERRHCHCLCHTLGHGSLSRQASC
jgi:hypothetical protein